MSYNPELLIPNWVAWRLTAEHTDGDYPRDNTYYEDEDVPFPKATNEDYKGSGWSKGHMCPAGDNKWDAEAMRESNLLTNICPQHSSLNSGLWNVIERDCRKWAKRYGEANKFYNLYGFDIVDADQSRYIDYYSFMTSRNDANHLYNTPYPQVLLLRDKFLFYKYMRSNGLPVPEVFAISINGEVYDTNFNEIPHEALRGKQEYL